MPDEEEAIQEGDYLEIDGICKFPDEVNAKPSGVKIASPFIGFSDLIKSLVIDTEDGPKEVPYVPGVQKVIGFVKDMLTIDFLQGAYGGRGIVVASPKNPKKYMTLDEWKDQFGTDALALILMMRLWWKTTGGGVQTGKPDTKMDTVFTKLGEGGRTTIR